MQLVSRKVLFDVMSHKKDIRFKNVDINEFDSSDATAFQTFTQKANTCYQQANAEYDKRDIAMAVFNNDMYTFMEENKDVVKYVGDGSSRIVFALANGTAFKLAKNDAGIAQNKQEAKLCLKPQVKYQIFPDFYDADEKEWLTLNCELCSKATKVDFAKIFQINPEELVQAIEFIIQTKLQQSELRKAQQHFLNNQTYRLAIFISKLIENKTEATKAMNSLLDFYRKYGLDELLLGDLESPANWGLTIRNNERVLVIIDAGFNEDIYQTFYNKPLDRRKNSLS